MKRCAKWMGGCLLVLAPCGAQAACEAGGFSWLGCAPELPPISSGWTGSSSQAPNLEAALHLAEWSNSEQSSNRLRLHFDARSETEDMLRRWRYGAGLDLGLPGDGMLQASISTSRRRRGEGARYALTSDGLATGHSQPLWALGLSLAPEEGSDGRRLMLAPQLRVDMDRWLDVPGRAEMYVEYTSWAHSVSGDVDDAQRRRDMDQRVPQLRLRWRF